jgi:hypothetical protein
MAIRNLTLAYEYRLAAGLTIAALLQNCYQNGFDVPSKSVVILNPANNGRP